MSSERAGTPTHGTLNREKVEALVDEGDIYLAEFEATDSWGSGGLVPAREQTVTRFLDALEACVVQDPRIARIEALLDERERRAYDEEGYTLTGGLTGQLRAILRGEQ